MRWIHVRCYLTSGMDPDKDYSDKEQPFTDGEENDPEIDDDRCQLYRGQTAPHKSRGPPTI